MFRRSTTAPSTGTPPRARRRLAPCPRLFAVLVAVLLASVAIAPPAPAQAATPQAATPPAPSAGLTKGRATHFLLGDGKGTNGHCSAPKRPADELYVALSPGEYAGAAACGTYMDVYGPRGTVRVLVIDECPECEHGHVDLSETAFRRIGDFNAGIIHVSYSPVTNPSVGPLAFRMKDGSNPWWFALQVLGNGNRLASVEVRVGSRWISTTLSEYNYWIVPRGLGGGPFTVRVTDVRGHSAVVSGITLRPGVVQQTHTQLYSAH